MNNKQQEKDFDRNSILNNSNIVEDFEEQESLSPSEGGKLEENKRSTRYHRPLGQNYKVGLPLATQRAIALRVFKFGEHDNFKEACNNNPTLFGPKGSEFRRKVQKKRNSILALKRNHPENFEELVHSLCNPRNKESPQEVSSSSEEENSFEQKNKTLVVPFSAAASSPSLSSPNTSFYKVCSPVTVTSQKKKQTCRTKVEELIFPISMSSSGKPKTLADDEEANLPAFMVNLDEGEQNVNGWLFYESNAFKWTSTNGVLTESINSIVMVKAIPDVYDIWGTSFNEKMSVTLLQDGSGVVVDEPSISSFLYTDIDVIFQHAFDGYPHDMKEAVKDAHGCAVNAIIDDKRRKRMKYRLMFPRDRVGAKGYWNRGAKGLKLTPFPFTNEETLTKEMTGASDDANFSTTVVVYLIPVDKEGRVLKVQDDEEVPIEKMFRNFSRLSVTNKKRNKRNNVPASSTNTANAANNNAGGTGGNNGTTMVDDDDDMLGGLDDD